MLSDLLSAVRQRDPAAPKHAWQVFMLYPGVQAILLHRISHKLWLWHFGFLARFFSFVIRFLTGIEIHPGAKLGQGIFIDHGMGVVIGETAQIGNNCTIYHGVTLGGISPTSKGKRHPTLKDGVVVGAGAALLGPIEVGQDVRIGSNAVVVRDVPAGMTAVGIPARLVARKEIKAVGPTKPFEAYGAVEDLPYQDPILHRINQLASRVKYLENQLNNRKIQEKSIQIDD